MLASALALAQGVKIGVFADQSGTYADFDGKWSVEAAKMAVEDFGGSVLGEKIELIDADHQNKVDLATAIARRWYDVEGVDMISDLTLSSIALAVQAIAAEEEKDRYRRGLVNVGADRPGLHRLRLSLGL